MEWAGSLSLLQGIFPTQGSNWGLLHSRWILYQLSYQESPTSEALFCPGSVSSVQFSHSVMSNSVIPWFAAHQASLSITNSRNLPKLMFIESVMPSNHLILCHPASPPAFNLSQHQGLFQRVSSSHQVAKVLKFQLQHQSFQ